MNENFARFLSMSAQDRRDVFWDAAVRLGTKPAHMEKDFWICIVLDALYNRLPEGHPRILFKGGTSLSKAFNLIRRFSEDVDIVVYREDIGFYESRDPTQPSAISNKQRRRIFEELEAACRDYVRGELAAALTAILGERCEILPDEKDVDQQSLLVKYPSLYPDRGDSYVLPPVKLEAGARSALQPSVTAEIAPYIADVVSSDFPLKVGNINVIQPERTYLDKLLILHGVHCGYRDENRLPRGGSRISRHYYDVAMLSTSEVGQKAVKDLALLQNVREHSQIAFRQAWKKLDEAVPGTIRLVPQEELRQVIERDYQQMGEMMLGAPPPFDWIIGQIQLVEKQINKR